MTEPALRTSGLVKKYADLVAVNGIDLEVNHGGITLLTGPNGAGKTTVLKLAAGLLEPTEGEVFVSGHPAGSIDARRLAAYVPDHPSLYEDISLEEQIEYTARVHGVEGWEAKARSYLTEFGMEDRADSLTSGFSRGMKQKASLILAFIRPFELLLADEPYAFLDKDSKEGLSRLLATAAAGGAAVVIASHEWNYGLSAQLVRLEDGVTIDR